MKRSISYTTPCGYRDDSWVERGALAKLHYGFRNPTLIGIEIISSGEDFRFAIIRKAAIIAQNRPVLSHNIAFGHGKLDLAPAITLAFRDQTPRQVTLNREALTVFLARTQLLIPVDMEEKALREAQSAQAAVRPNPQPL